MAVKKKDILDNEEGQAIFELILFMPFLVYFVTLLFTAGNAINGSINQQKATRGYFYHILKGNSLLPVRSDLDAFKGEGIRTVSAASLGWAEKRPDDLNFGTCYKFSTLYSSSEEECDQKAPEPNTTIFVRPFTFYGVCSATYVMMGDGEYYLDPSVAASENCTMIQ
ncbi:MAG: hypothetical protein ACJAT2_003266 [Bacteriovoracaceae bacterium]|jgi:hypothetical protein